MQSSFLLMDIGIWILSDRAVELLMKRSKKDDSLRYYDLYSVLDGALGGNPKVEDDELRELSVAYCRCRMGSFIITVQVVN